MTDQPQPTISERSQPVPPLVRKHAARVGNDEPEMLTRLAERDRIGRERYGQSLHTHDGRDTGQDADDEALDLAQYAVKWKAELADGCTCGGKWTCDACRWSAEAGGIATTALDLAWRINRLREEVAKLRDNGGGA